MSLPRIRRIHIRTVRVPLPEPHQTASGVICESPLVLTDVETDAGIVGRSLIFTFFSGALEPTAGMVRTCASLLEGDELSVPDLEAKLRLHFKLLGTRGLVGMAIAAIDMAAWDAFAQWRQLPLHRHLGAVRTAVPAYASVGFDGVAGSARAAGSWASKGFKGVKLRIGYPTLHEDIEAIRAVRRAVGDAVSIMVDYNQCLSVDEATVRLKALDDEGLEWIEEPIHCHDMSGYRRLAKVVRTPIQWGENWSDEYAMQEAIDAGVSNLVMPDVMKMGGISGWRRAEALSCVHALKISTHLWPELGARLLCSAPNAHWLEYVDWWNPILAEPLVVKDGIAHVDERPGSGVVWSEKAIIQFQG